MATSVSAFIAVIPAGTPPGAMHSVALNVNHQDPVVAVHWRVPPGPRGHLGWFLAQSGVQVLPNQFGTLMVCDGQSDTWPLDNFPQSGAWSCVGFNTGTKDHSVFLEFEHAQLGPGSNELAGDIFAGFPTVDLQLQSMWTSPGLILA
jgi:hypothetical protein